MDNELKTPSALPPYQMKSDWFVSVDGLDIWENKYSFAFAMNRNPDTPSYIMVTTLTELFRVRIDKITWKLKINKTGNINIT